MDTKSPASEPGSAEQRKKCRPFEWTEEEQAWRDEIASLRAQLQERAREILHLDNARETLAQQLAASEATIQRLRVDTLLEASRAVCAYCADPDLWLPAKKGTYPEWWHVSAKGWNVRNLCSAWAIHHLLEKAALVQPEAGKENP